MEYRTPLEKISDFPLLKDKVYEIIKKNIIGLSLPPNSQLVEKRLAEEMGVSKSPIREALLRLEREGLVYTIPFKGCFVAKITPQDLQETFQLREALETYCVQQGCEAFSGKEINRLKEILVEGDEALQANDVNRCYSVNTLFHDTLVSNTKNSKIQRTYANLRDHLDRYRNIASRILGRVAKSHQEHVLIIQAMEVRDDAQARKQIVDHVRSVLIDILHSEELGSSD